MFGGCGFGHEDALARTNLDAWFVGTVHAGYSIVSTLTGSKPVGFIISVKSSYGLAFMQMLTVSIVRAVEEINNVVIHGGMVNKVSG